MPRFSIRQLLIATAFIGVGCFALLNASSWVAAASLGGVALALSAAVLFAIYRDGERRAYWIGFTVLGWTYLFLCFSGLLSVTSLSWQGNVTALLAGALYDRAYANQPLPATSFTYMQTTPYPPPTSTIPNANPYQPVPVVPNGGTVTYTAVAVQPSIGPDRESFLYVAHALWTLLIATCGGWLAVWLYATRPRPTGQEQR
jgi:hypothetical protein